jgi:hypothetical protein
MDTQAFYAVTGGVAFTLLGLWQVVVVTHPDWQHSRARRLLAYAVGLQFLLPGMMSILSMIAPDEPLVWRVVFTVSAVVGILSVVLFRRALLEDYDVPRLSAVVGWVVLPVYLLIAILALVPTLPRDLGLSLSGIQVEALLVSVLLFLGIQAAWILLLEPPRSTSGEGDPGGQGGGPAG